MKPFLVYAAAAFVLCASVRVAGQLVDQNKAPNTSNDGISRPLIGEPSPSQIGEGRSGSGNTSLHVIELDPFRAIRRGRQLFQRKFTRLEGQGPGSGDGFGNIDTDVTIGAGVADSCAACHGRPRGAAGFGGDVVTRPDSRDAPHLFGIGLKEMLADEITTELRLIQSQALNEWRLTHRAINKVLISKGIEYGTIIIRDNGQIDMSQVRGVNPDLRVRPFFAHGAKISIRESAIGAFNEEMGLQSVDPDLT